MARNRSRSSSGWRKFMLSARTRRLNASHDSSRLKNRAGWSLRSPTGGAGGAATPTEGAGAAMGDASFGDITDSRTSSDAAQAWPGKVKAVIRRRLPEGRCLAERFQGLVCHVHCDVFVTGQPPDLQ